MERKFILISMFILVVIISVSCYRTKNTNQIRECSKITNPQNVVYDKSDFDKIESVQEKYGYKILRIPEVIGHGIGWCDNALCIQVYLGEYNANSIQALPNKLEEFEVCYEITGPIIAQ